MVQAADEKRKGTAGGRQAYLQLRETVGHTAEDQMGGGDAGVKRVAEKVEQVIGPQALHADDLEGMQEERQAGVLQHLVDGEEIGRR